MAESVSDVDTLNVNRQSTQQNVSVEGSQALFRGISIHPNRTIPNSNPAIKETRIYDAVINSTSVNATGWVRFGVGAIALNDTVTINGVTYTAVDGTKANNTQFSRDGMVSEAIDDLIDSISNDTRTGTLPGTITPSRDATQEAQANLITSLPGTEGNAITLAEASAGIEVSGATFTGGMDGPVTENVAVRQVTVPNEVGGIPVQITSFLTGLETTRAEMHVIPIGNRNGVSEYDVFWSATGTGSITVDLTVVTVRAPSNQPPSTFPDLPDQDDPTAFEAVLREDNGIEKVYDCFYLSTQ